MAVHTFLFLFKITIFHRIFGPFTEEKGPEYYPTVGSSKQPLML